MSEAERGRVLSRGWLFWPATLFCAALVLYLQLFHLVPLPCVGVVPSLVCEKITLQSDSTLPGILSFLIALIWLVLFVVLAFRRVYAYGEFEALARQISRFIAETKFSQAAELLEANLDKISLAAGEKDWRSRAVTWADRHSVNSNQISFAEAGILDVEDGEFPEARSGSYPDFLRPIPQRVLEKILPENKRPSAMAMRMLEEVSFDLKFAAYLAKVRPEIGTKLVLAGGSYIERFSISFFYFMLKDCNSQIFLEQKYLQEAPNLYNGRDAGLLSRHFFVDSSVAARTEVYRYVGEAMLEIFGEARRSSYAEDLNSVEMGMFSASNERSTSGCDPLPASLAFFNAIVSYAAIDGVRWHMWLYYVEHFADRLLGLLEPIEAISSLPEFPNKLLRDLYDCFYYLSLWLDLHEDERIGRHHQSPEHVDNRHENGNIPKSAALCLGSVFAKTIANENVPHSFKVDRLSSILRTIRRHQEKAGSTHWAEVLSLCIVHRGPIAANADHLIELEHLMSRVDPHLLAEVPLLSEEIDKAHARLHP